MKLNRKHIISAGKTVAVALFMVIAISFTSREEDGDICRDLVINISNQADNYFLDDAQVRNIITDHGNDVVTGKPYTELNLKEMEDRVREENYVDEVEVYRDLKGNLIVNVSLKRPMARIVRRGAPHAYIAEDGTIMPVSDNYTSRVMLISGSYAPRLISGEEADSGNNEKILSMLREVYEDPFWKSQIAQIDIDSKLNMTIYPQVTRQKIEFGKPENLEEKFEKLMIFYKKILPSKGWNAYERVNVEFKDQIIAE